jgi:hypothetical protein
MTNSMRIRLAALAIAIFIGALSVAGLALRDHGQVAAKAPQVQTQAQSQAAPAVSTFGEDEAEFDED